ncbi:MAG TPA: YXWGXW repeat-containing protein [Candidatus Angelobacter sp.]|nr:YXWGXW repeat-containing protein [Candidatus Angelobacter sp.]
MRSNSWVRFLLIIVLLLTLSAALYAQIGIVVNFGPPALPIYTQPLCPGPGYLWTPGYWAWDPDFGDYFWVPGTWVLPPTVGFLWTPGYWGWHGGGFIFYEGYWGPVVGFYGGINYGFGYFGHGYEGGRWDHGQFYYNREVNNINVTNIHNVYNTRITNVTENHVSYNGGEGGINARPTAEEEAAARERHIPPVSGQFQQLHTARANPQLRASVNNGKPPIAATQRPGEFQAKAIVPAREAGAPYHPPANRVAGPAHASELPQHTNGSVYTGNPTADQQNQREQEQLNTRQNQEHQQLQQQQEQAHQQLRQQQANQEAQRQMEQQHQQQAMQMERLHAQQQQQMHMQQMQRAPQPHGSPGRPRGR